MDRKKVLVIYGKDQKLTGDIRHFLRKIGLHPVELPDQFPRGVPDPHKVLQTAIKAACAIVVVLTGDDEARLQERWYIPDEDEEDERRPFPQPRLSVLFGAGIALATRPKKTILVKRGSVRLCRYFEGCRLVELGDPLEQRRAFIETLCGVGCAVDLSSNEWIDVGDFSDPDS
jgi:Predicted nucleotide-binding protein containing TIR-like domain